MDRNAAMRLSLLIVLITFSTFIYAKECPTQFNGEYLWLDELNGNPERKSFFDGELVVTLELDELCESLRVEWKHSDYFSLEWTNYEGDFTAVADAEGEWQKLSFSKDEIEEHLRNDRNQTTTITIYQLIEPNILKITTKTKTRDYDLAREEIKILKRQN